MGDDDRASKRTVKRRIRGLLRGAPWHLMAAAYRVLYGFHLEGAENLPSEGPFILAIHEPSLIGVFASGWLSIVALRRALDPDKVRMMALMQDQLFAISYFRELLNAEGPPRFGALVPHSAGRMALSLVDGYRALRDGGVVAINPEGDGPWDGRPLPTGKAPAWLGLHTGAPIVPAICSIGAYDIWPRWGHRPYLRGRLRMAVGEPFVLAAEPLARVTDEDIAAATARVRAVYDELRYGPGGYAEWVGCPTHRGKPVDDLPQLRPAGAVKPLSSTDRVQVSVARRGVAQLLWRCPVCHEDDALMHRRHLFGPHDVSCLACDTRWKLRHVPERDFRLEVADGAPELVGLDMALTAWYDEMKRDFRPVPIDAPGVVLGPREEVYLEASGVSLSPHRPNPLLDGDWNAREVPDEQSGPQQLGQWETIGEGRLLLTSQRMIWQGANRRLEFRWSRVTAIYLWLRNTLGILYGTARYRLGLGQELGLKWLTYAGTLASQADRETGFELTLSPY